MNIIVAFMKKNIFPAYLYGFYWLPIGITAGIFSFFETSDILYLWIMPSMILCVTGGFYIKYKHYIPYILSFIMIGFIIGLLASYIHHIRHYEQYPLKKALYNTQFTGTVQDKIDTGGKIYFIIKNNTPNNTKDIKNIPEYIRMTLKKDLDITLYPNDKISFTAHLYPLPQSAFRGDYDFSFFARHEGLGAVGHITNVTKVTHFPETFGYKIQSLRTFIKDKIFQNMSYDNAAITTAMITGARTEINSELDKIWKESGIYHIISISGLHMSVIAGLMFFIGRKIVFLCPPIARHYDTKKIAAVFAILCALFYTLLSGQSVPAVRSFITISIMLGAVLVDRQALSLRNGLFAYMLILIINPSQLYYISFCLSFAAVLGILCVVDILKEFYNQYDDVILNKKQKLISFISVSMGASYASTPLSVYIFGTMSQYGFITNFLAIPFTGLFLMPAIVFALFMIPFRLEYYPFLGVDYLMDILNLWAKFITDTQDGMMILTKPHIIHIGLFYIGLYLSALFTGKMRLLGGSLIILSVTLYIFYKPSDIIKLYNPYMIAFVDTNHHIRILDHRQRYKPSDYLHSRLAQHFGVDATKDYYISYCDDTARNRVFTSRDGHKIKCTQKSFLIE